MKKILSLLVAAGVIITSAQAGAADLPQATRTLPGDEEWSIMARASIGQGVDESFLRTRLAGGSATDYEKRILAVTAAGRDPRSWGEENFVASLLAKFDGNQMGDVALLNDDIFGLLALKSAGETGSVVDRLRAYILSNQNPDGGWSFSVGGNSDTNTTAMAVAALRTTGSAPDGAITYLLAGQDGEGGFGYAPGQDPDGASTAWVVMGLRANGSPVPNSALDFLDSLQTASGSFRWRPTDASGSALVTAYSVIALSGRTLPIRSISGGNPAPAPSPSPTPAPVPQPIPTPAPGPTPIPSINNAECTGLSAPSRVHPRQALTAVMDFRNSGTRPWTTDASPHRLGSQNPRDSVTWGGSRASLPANEIRPGQTARFILALTAPANPGIYPLAAQMLEEGVEWFGETCATAVTVADDPTPAPAPSPAPAPNPSPAPAPNPGPMPTPAGQFRVSISYPGNVIYVGDVSFGSTTYAAGGQIYSLNSPRAIGTLIAAASDANLLYEIQPQAFGPFVRSINGYGPNGARGWLYAVNGQIPQVPSSDYVLNPGDEVRWFFGDADTSPY